MVTQVGAGKEWDTEEGHWLRRVSVTRAITKMTKRRLPHFGRSSAGM